MSGLTTAVVVTAGVLILRDRRPRRRAFQMHGRMLPPVMVDVTFGAFLLVLKL